MDKEQAPAYAKEGNPSKQNDSKIDERHYRYAHKHITRQQLNHDNYIFFNVTKSTVCTYVASSFILQLQKGVT